MQSAHSTLALELPDGRTSQIMIGAGLASDPGCYAALAGKRVLLVCDAAVADTAGRQAAAALDHAAVATIVIEGAEGCKTWQEAAALCERMAEAGLERGDALVVVGGGAVTDLAGFAAGIYQRGIAAAYVPTTLLAQIDAAVGGKTGINLAAGKNLVGVFRQPVAVIADVSTLQTLPPRQWSAGMAEAVKHAMLNTRLWEFLEAKLDSSGPAVLGERAISELITLNIRCKAAIVASDERERSSRMLLNLGHTFAHALEAALGYGDLAHGEAVACGLLAASRLSAKLGFAPASLEDEVRRMLERCSHPDHPLPQAWPAHDRESFWAALERDKKRAGHPRYVLPRAPGDVFVHPDPIGRETVDRVIDSLLAS